MIWKSALPGPRVVDLCTNGEVRRGEYGYDHLITHCPPPGMLQACSESRAVAKKDYTVFFNHHINMKPQYFNFEIDTLYIPNIPLAFIALLEPILKGFEDEEDSILTRLRHLMVAGQIGETWGRVGYIMLDEFSNLDTLVLEQPLPDSFDPEDVNAEELSLEATSKLEHNVRLGVWCGKDLETDSYPSISFLPGQAMDDRAIAMRVSPLQARSVNFTNILSMEHNAIADSFQS